MENKFPGGILNKEIFFKHFLRKTSFIFLQTFSPRIVDSFFLKYAIKFGRKGLVK
jgi:hypothetical protein